MLLVELERSALYHEADSLAPALHLVGRLGPHILERWLSRLILTIGLRRHVWLTWLSHRAETTCWFGMIGDIGMALFFACLF